MVNDDKITIDKQEGKVLFAGLQKDNCLIINNNNTVIPIYESTDEEHEILLLDGDINFEYSLIIYDFSTMGRYEFDVP